LIPSPAKRFAHADHSSHGFDIVVELINACQDGFDETSVRRFIYAFGHGAEAHAGTCKQGPHGVMIRSVSGKARERVDDQVLNLAPVLLAESKQPQELRSLRRLSGLTAIDEDLGNLQIMVVAILAAVLLLNFEAQVLGLFEGRDSRVDDCTHRLRLRWPTTVRRERQSFGLISRQSTVELENCRAFFDIRSFFF
jgi:hypothetical protein